MRSTSSVFHVAMEHLTRAEIQHLLETQPVAHIGVVDDGVPYVTPVSFVYFEEAVWFRTGEGRRLGAMRQNPRTCVEVTRYHPYTGMWESVVGWGDAVILLDAKEQLRLADLLESKYRDPLEALEGIDVDRTETDELAVVQIRLDEASGRASLRPGGRRTRPGRL